MLLTRPSASARRAGRALAVVATAAVATVVPLAVPAALPVASAAVAASCGASVPVYGVAADGSLREWIDAAPVSAGGVTAVAAPVGVGWGGFTRLLAAGGGVLYALSPDGRLRWYRHTGTLSGAATWAPGGGSVIGVGWGGFTQVVSAGNGIIYAVAGDGTLRWYRHTGGATGAATWAPGSGSVVGWGWSGFTRLVAGPFGVIYAVSADGALHWYAHDGWLTGRAVWATGSGTAVGSLWAGFAALLSGGGGLLYGVRADGTVHWYNHTGAATGAVTWASGGGALLTGLTLTGITLLTADPTACTGLDPNDITAVRRVAAGVLSGAGWAAAQFSCLSSIASVESSWRWNAGSPTGSYGIPQAMPGSKMASVAADWQINPITQVRWMLAYVVGKYASPCAAWAFWQAHHYY